jgi:predicted site-specific integrase-resolvase
VPSVPAFSHCYRKVGSWGISHSRRHKSAKALRLVPPSLRNRRSESWYNLPCMPSTMTMSPVVPAAAAQYVRMSTELQQYSIENQKATIQEYAEQHGFVVVKTYADAGRTGIVLKHRKGLSALLKGCLEREYRLRCDFGLRHQQMGSFPRYG